MLRRARDRDGHPVLHEPRVCAPVHQGDAVGWHMPHGLICSAFYHVCCFSTMPLPHVSSDLAAGIHVPLFLLLLLTGITVIVMITCTFI